MSEEEEINPSKRQQKNDLIIELERRLFEAEERYLKGYHIRMRLEDALYKMEKKKNEWKLFAFILLAIIAFLLFLILVT